MKTNSPNWTKAGAAPKPTIHLHPWTLLDIIQPMVYATTWPSVINRIFSVTNLPRKAEGESSEIYLVRRSVHILLHNYSSHTYSGTTKLAPPMARPTILLPAIIPDTLVVIACHSAPMTNKTSATTTTLFRPRLSARIPATGLATSAKRLVQEVMRLLSRVVNGRERSAPMETRVEEMTPVL